jgi:hypothetical protein
VTNTAPDLVVTSVSIPTAAFSGDSVTVAWTVKNVGAAAVWRGTERWVDYVYISPDANFIASRASLVASVVHAASQPLQGGESYTASATIGAVSIAIRSRMVAS